VPIITGAPLLIIGKHGKSLLESEFVEVSAKSLYSFAFARYCMSLNMRFPLLKRLRLSA
jgi:hypothetical protein